VVGRLEGGEEEEEDDVVLMETGGSWLEGDVEEVEEEEWKMVGRGREGRK